MNQRRVCLLPENVNMLVFFFVAKNLNVIMHNYLYRLRKLLIYRDNIDILIIWWSYCDKYLCGITQAYFLFCQAYQYYYCKQQMLGWEGLGTRLQQSPRPFCKQPMLCVLVSTADCLKVEEIDSEIILEGVTTFISSPDTHLWQEVSSSAVHHWGVWMFEHEDYWAWGLCDH